MSFIIRKVNYYETDRMGITHHSNYVRWMEEARVRLLDDIGYGLKKLEQDGITSPVVDIECHYKKTTTFDDEVRIDVSVEKYSGVKLVFKYTITNTADESIVFTAKSSHCFINESGKPIAVKKHYPELDSIFASLAAVKKSEAAQEAL